MYQRKPRQQPKRRHATILAADIAGYSRLMGRDDEGTLTTLKAHRRELIDPSIREHRGRIVKTTGDGLLAEFASPIEAVRCAVGIQRGMLDRNAKVPEDRRILFRMGINLGDVIEDDGDLFGDGVNVAARLEALSDAGGVCISRAVEEQVRDKLPFTFEDAGDQQAKNIARPVRVFRMRAQVIEVLPPTHKVAAFAEPSRVPLITAGVIGALLLVGIGGWWLARERPTSLGFCTWTDPGCVGSDETGCSAEPIIPKPDSAPDRGSAPPVHCRLALLESGQQLGAGLPG